MQYIMTLKGAVYGYQPLWEDSVFRFRVRNPPAINPAEPLRGLKIAIDPGHPPVGATGPTGLWEPEGTLPVGLKVRELLQAKGVDVFMTRTTPDPVDLNLRGTMARRENAHAFVSIHLNALPDGTAHPARRAVHPRRDRLVPARMERRHTTIICIPARLPLPCRLRK